MTNGVSRETLEGAPTLEIVAVTKMIRTGKPKTVSLAVDAPTRTYDQHTEPTLCAGRTLPSICLLELYTAYLYAYTLAL